MLTLSGIKILLTSSNTGVNCSLHLLYSVLYMVIVIILLFVQGNSILISNRCYKTVTWGLIKKCWVNLWKLRIVLARIVGSRCIHVVPTWCCCIRHLTVSIWNCQQLPYCIMLIYFHCIKYFTSCSFLGFWVQGSHMDPYIWCIWWLPYCQIKPLTKTGVREQMFWHGGFAVHQTPVL